MNTYGNHSRTTKGYMPHPDEHTKHSPQHHTTIEATHPKFKFPESSSEECVLPIQNGITKTTEISVGYNELEAKDVERN